MVVNGRKATKRYVHWLTNRWGNGQRLATPGWVQVSGLNWVDGYDIDPKRKHKIK
jgi:hypothetical protein